jgi:hypothetical protein
MLAYFSHGLICCNRWSTGCMYVREFAAPLCGMQHSLFLISAMIQQLEALITITWCKMISTFMESKIYYCINRGLSLGHDLVYFSHFPVFLCFFLKIHFNITSSLCVSFSVPLGKSPSTFVQVYVRRLAYSVHLIIRDILMLFNPACIYKQTVAITVEWNLSM